MVILAFTSRSAPHPFVPDMSRFLAFLLPSLPLIAPVIAESCTTDQLTTLASNSHVTPCATALGFPEILGLAALSSNQVKMFCANKACMALYQDVQTMGFGDCEILSTGTSMQKDIIDPVTEECGDSGSTSSLSSSSAAAIAGASEASSSSGSSTSSTSLVVVLFVGVALSVMLV